MALGSPKAPVTVIEYASVGCPHCGVWAREVFPVFKAKYVDTGRVRFVFHELLTGDPALAAAGFLLARCVAPTKYFQVVDAIFADQDRIAAEGPAGQLLQIAKTAGLSEAQYSACLADEAALDALNARTEKDARDHGVTGTPTFFVGGEKLTGEQSLAALDAAIAHAAPKH
jgi:protein-disulfide isomerase